MPTPKVTTKKTALPTKKTPPRAKAQLTSKGRSQGRGPRAEFNQESYDDALDQLKARLEAAAISYVEVETEMTSGMRRVLRFEFPSGDSTRTVSVLTEVRARQLLHTALEDIKISPVFQGIFNQSSSYIEARIADLSGRGPTQILQVISGRRITHEEETPTFPLSGAPQGVAASIGPPSPEFAALVGTQVPSNELSLRVEGIPFESGASADVLIGELADALFFRLDVETGMAIGLRRWIRLREQLRALADIPSLFEFPTNRYDMEPASLYWYARSASNMPLLQFLAFYQVLEFYFPVFSQKEALRRISRAIKQPNFSPDSETQLVKVLRAVGSTSARSFGSERNQLKSTLSECITEDEVKEFVESEDSRKDFLTSVDKALTDKRLVLGKSNVDLLDQVADRVYDIRCKIVHTKLDDDFQLLLPFSKEASLLKHDVALLEILAQQALVVGSKAWK